MLDSLRLWRHFPFVRPEEDEKEKEEIRVNMEKYLKMKILKSLTGKMNK